MDELLTLPWETIDDSSPIASRMAAWAAREIIERRFEPGELLIEADLAAAQKASRTPAREAMLQLERWRLVRLAPKKGAIVTAVTGEERRDLLAVRAMFETDALRALGADAEVLDGLAADLRILLDRQREALADDSPLAFASSDYAFHARIIRSGRNRITDELLSIIGPRLARLTYRAVIEQPSALEDLFADHEKLTECARQGDASRFTTLVHQHIEHGHFQQKRVR
ncbi:MAG: GntR family transcriptional regulator [Brevibacterium sp.]